MEIFFYKENLRNLNKKLIQIFYFYYLKNLDIEKLNINEIIFESKNLISFKIDKKFKFSNLKY